jgi:hypothetical protein
MDDYEFSGFARDDVSRFFMVNVPNKHVRFPAAEFPENSARLP